MSEIESMSSYVEVNGWPVWYEKFGYGPMPIILLSGAMGTGRSDFLEQLDGDDALDFTKFTLIAVEAPGWGRSRPPARKYGNNLYNNDAECFHGLMQELGYEKYSIIGWSDGAKTSILMAIKYPKAIQSVVVTGMSTKVTQTATKILLSTQNIEGWAKEKKGYYLRSYKTLDDLQMLWTRFLKFVEYYHQYYPEDMYKNKYHLVRCPVLILHGDRDQMIDVEQPLHVCKNIKGAKLQRFPLASHDLHQRYAATFKKLTEDHILGSYGLINNLI